MRTLRSSLPKRGELSLAVIEELSGHVLDRIKLRPFKMRIVSLPQSLQPWSWKHAFSLPFQDSFSKSEFVLLPWSADDYGDFLLNSLASNFVGLLPSNFIPLWGSVSDAEASLYASLAGVSWRISSERPFLAFWRPLLDADSSLLFGLQKSAEEILALSESFAKKTSEMIPDVP